MKIKECPECHSYYDGYEALNKSEDVKEYVQKIEECLRSLPSDVGSSDKIAHEFCLWVSRNKELLEGLK